MTTQARELAKLVTNAGDVNLGDDISLASDGAVLNFGADSDVTLTHVADTGLLLNSSRRIQFGDSGTHIRQSADGVLNLTSDTEIELNATTLDINANVDISGTLTVAGALDFGDLDISNVGSIALDTITNDGTDITLDSSGDIVLDADGGDIRFKDGGTEIAVFENSSSDLQIKASVQDKDIIFRGNDGGSGINALTLDFSEAGAAAFNSTITATTATFTTSATDDPLSLVYTGAAANVGPVLKLYRNSGSPADSDALGEARFIGKNDAAEDVNYAQILVYAEDVSNGTEDGAMYIKTILAGTARNTVSLLPSGVVINDESQDVDFRVESNGNANMLFVDGGGDSVNVGTTTNTYNAALVVNNESGELGFDVTDGTTHVGTWGTGGVGTIGTRSNHDLSFKTNDGERMRILAAGNVGIGDTNPGAKLDVNSGTTNTMAHFHSTDDNGFIELKDDNTTGYIGVQDDYLYIGGAASTSTQNLVINDGACKVGIGTTSPSCPLDIVDSSASAPGTVLRVFSAQNSAAADGLVYIHADNDVAPFTTLNVIQDGTGLGSDVNCTKATDNRTVAIFEGQGIGGSQASGGQYVSITRTGPISNASGNVVGGLLLANGSSVTGANCGIRGTYEFNSGRDLQFFTSSDNSSAPTNKMLLKGDGRVWIRNTTANYDGGQLQMTSASTCQTMYVTNTGFADPQVVMAVERGANSAYKFFNMYSGRRPDNGGGDVEFQIRGDGNAYADGSWAGGGADYAEYFEWSDGNASSQDRIGLSVVLDGNKIREATESDAAGTIIGVISGNPAVVGDTAYTKWTDKYQKDDYGRYVLDSDGHRQENSDYNDSLTYVEREKRKEWDTVGLMGKLRIKKGQQTGTNWIKMRDISASVEEWLVR